MNLKRITRLLSLLQTLQAGHADNADGLARASGVSRRTAFRDLETLKEAGVPLAFDSRDSRHSIAGEFFLPPTNFTTAEALSIIALAGQLGADEREPFFGPARSAALKLESGLPKLLRKQVQSITQSLSLQINAPQMLNGKQAVYDQLVDAIAQRRVVRITYESLTEWKQITTNLRPYHLMFNRRSWYAIGRSSLHGEVRTFNVGRIASLEVLDQRFARPRGFSVEKYLGNVWNMMPQAGEDVHVVVRFDPLVAQNVAEVAWHKTQRLEFQEDGSLEFHVDVSGLNEIVWWILGYGDQAEVLRPAKLRRLVLQRAQSMSRKYEK